MMITAGLAFAEDGPPAGPSRNVQDLKASQPTAAAKVGVAPQEKMQPAKSLDSLL